MKRIVRLTESDLKRIVKKTIREMSGDDMDYDFSYDIRSVNCGDNMMSGHVDIDEDDTIVIRYCEGNEDDLEYLKEKGRRLLSNKNQLPRDIYRR